MHLIGIDEFRAAAREKRTHGGDGVYHVATGEVRQVENMPRTLQFVFSDSTVDRMGDTIAADGWETADFLKNPVALWAHDSSSPPIGRASDLGVEGSRLLGNIEFVGPETYAFGDTIYRLLLGRFLRAVSVGFLPLEYSFIENDPTRGFGIDFKRQTLLEISVVPVPANANALQEARSKGIDTRPLVAWAERTLESGDQIIIPRAELEALRKAAKEKPMARRLAGTRRRAEDEPDDKPEDPEEKAPGGATCGRKAADECGLKDSTECAIHGKGTKAEDDPDDDKPDDSEKRLRRLERQLERLTGVLRANGDEPDGDELPLEHHDAVRMAHKHIKTAHVYSKEEGDCIRRAVGLLGDVVESLNGSSDDEPAGDDDKPDPEEKARQLKRAHDIRARLRSVA